MVFRHGSDLSGTGRRVDGRRDTVRLKAPEPPPIAPPRVRQPEEVWRVVAGDDRPLVLAVAGICPAAGATDLSWRLATTLAARGIQVALLMDMPERLVAQLPDEFRRVGTSLAVHGYDRSPPPGLAPEEAEDWKPSDRMTLALEVMVLASVIVVDLGDLPAALAREPQVLAVADRSIVTWPQSELRLWETARFLASLKHDRAIATVLSRAVHCAYLSPSAGPEMVQAVLAQTMEMAAPSVVPVPAGPQGADLQQLLQVLAPSEGRRWPRGRDLMAALRGQGATTGPAQGMRHWLGWLR